MAPPSVLVGQQPDLRLEAAFSQLLRATIGALRRWRPLAGGARVSFARVRSRSTLAPLRSLTTDCARARAPSADRGSTCSRWWRRSADRHPGVARRIRTAFRYWTKRSG